MEMQDVVDDVINVKNLTEMKKKLEEQYQPKIKYYLFPHEVEILKEKGLFDPKMMEQIQNG